MSYVKNVGEKVRSIRESKNLTQDELADRSKLSKELISRIESSKDLPFLAPLIRIARTLGVRMGTFLDESNETGPVIARSESRKSGISLHHLERQSTFDLNFFPLANDKADRHMEPFIIEIKPSGDKQYSMNTHEGEEFIYVLSGDVELSYGGDQYIISAGDSIYYESLTPHHVHSANNKPARVLAVVYTP
ncbi:MAG: cupin domain-containing protein [Bacteroidales bacterium]|nr:cupin domain-containing protein [Bacteroidales bacterium]MCB9013885.1 cupin domain-containing protein [Bacteroidales bacterium]